MKGLPVKGGTEKSPDQRFAILFSDGNTLKSHKQLKNEDLKSGTNKLYEIYEALTTLQGLANDKNYKAIDKTEDEKWLKRPDVQKRIDELE